MPSRSSTYTLLPPQTTVLLLLSPPLILTRCAKPLQTNDGTSGGRTSPSRLGTDSAWNHSPHPRPRHRQLLPRLPRLPWLPAARRLPATPTPRLGARVRRQASRSRGMAWQTSRLSLPSKGCHLTHTAGSAPEQRPPEAAGLDSGASSRRDPLANGPASTTRPPRPPCDPGAMPLLPLRQQHRDSPGAIPAGLTVGHRPIPLVFGDGTRAI